MQWYGSRTRDLGVYTWGITLVLSFPFHWVEAGWFWALVGGVMGLSAVTVAALEFLRLVAPGWTDEWWDPEQFPD